MGVLMHQSALVENRIASIFQAACSEAMRHRWIESQKRGCDLGEYAVRDWYQRYWWTFLRYRHVEHILGDVCWEEFPARSFAAVRPLLNGDDQLAVQIIDLYREGLENLDIIHWADRTGHSFEVVFECLLLINMNDARLDPKFN
jgi:hypothetical protein